MTKIEMINLIDLLLATMLVSHVFTAMMSSRRGLHRMTRLARLSGREHMGFFRILCNRVYGPEEMSLGKVCGIMIMAMSFFLLSLYGSLFGFFGLIITCTLGSVKVYYSMKSRLHNATQ